MRASALHHSAFMAAMAAPLTTGLALPDTATYTDSDPLLGAIASNANANTVRILVCGDSISQGREGDFTWRYRLWEWFHNNSLTHSTTTTTTTTTTPSAEDRLPQPSSSSSSSSSTNDAGNGKITYPAIQYVGPFNGTLPASVDAINVDPTNPQTWGTYHPTVSPLFSPGGGSSHFAVYGRPAWQDIEPMHEQVTAHSPDMLVLHLGFNDIGWWGNNATDLLFSVQRLVFNARLARPDIKILIADVSHRLAVAGREDIEGITNQYNDLLDSNAAQWWTEGSPVEVVKVSKVYDCQTTACPAGIDGLHPNSLGDFQIARAYTQVLHDKFHYGAAPLEVPAPETIPGLLASSAAVGGGHAPNPPVHFLAAGAGLFSLVLVAALKPEWLRLRRGRFGLGGVMKGRYHLLPSR